MGLRARDVRHHPRRRARVLRHAPRRDLLQGTPDPALCLALIAGFRQAHSAFLLLAGEDGGEAAEVRGAYARQGQGGAAAAGRGAAGGQSPAPTRLVTPTSMSSPLAPALP